MKRILLAVAVALLMPMEAAHAVDYPDVKEGLWQVQMQTVDSPSNTKSGGTIKLCRDHAYDKAVRAMAKNMKGCTIVSESLTGNRYTAETRCTVAGTTIDATSVATFSSDSAAHSETHSTYKPAFFGNTSEVMTQDQTYLGSCPTGMAPGDRMLPDGSIQHHAPLPH